MALERKRFHSTHHQLQDSLHSPLSTQLQRPQWLPCSIFKIPIYLPYESALCLVYHIGVSISLLHPLPFCSSACLFVQKSFDTFLRKLSIMSSSSQFFHSLTWWGVHMTRTEQFHFTELLYPQYSSTFNYFSSTCFAKPAREETQAGFICSPNWDFPLMLPLCRMGTEKWTLCYHLCWNGACHIQIWSCLSYTQACSLPSYSLGHYILPEDAD